MNRFPDDQVSRRLGKRSAVVRPKRPSSHSSFLLSWATVSVSLFPRLAYHNPCMVRRQKQQSAEPRPDRSGLKGSVPAVVGNDERPAGIEYVGVAGISRECRDAVLRLVQYGDQITHARILSCSILSRFSRRHCLLLSVGAGDLVAVKSGFASGYVGEGPRAFSYVLQVLDAHGVEIDECVVSQELIERVDKSSLTQADLKAIEAAEQVRPRTWDEYVIEPRLEMELVTKGCSGDLWREFPAVIPFAIIDRRIADLAISFWQGPDEKLLTGYRRLEDVVRERTAIDERGAKLFSRAFNPDGGKLTWKDTSPKECVGRMMLFTGTYMAYRNRRAHREPKGWGQRLLEEFLLLNQLYILEKEATEASES